MPKKRVSLTLEQELVDRIDSEASGNNLNRSQQVEDLLEEYFDGRSIRTAVIFCGGKEARSMKKFEGKPVLSHILDNLVDTTIEDVILLSGKNTDQISDHFGKEYRGLSISIVGDESPKGTARALEKVKNKVSGTFLVLNGHVLSDVDIDDMLKVHRAEEVTATMALTTVNDPSAYGVARLKGRTILGFEEKPSPGNEPSRLINAGTYILEPEIFDEINENSIEEVFEKLSTKRQLAGYIYGGKWKEFEV